LDSASLNYPGTDTLVPAIELAEICVIENIVIYWKTILNYSQKLFLAGG
jgi:hypothetical protein